MSLAQKLSLVLSRAQSTTNIPREMRSKVVGMLLARCIAFNLELPSSAVEDRDQYYNQIHRSVVNGLLSELNEQFALDARLLADLTRRIWGMRYAMVFEPMLEDPQDYFSVIARGRLINDIPEEYIAATDAVSEQDVRWIRNQLLNVFVDYAAAQAAANPVVEVSDE